MDITEEQYAVLSDCIVDPDEWINNAIEKVGELAVLEKIEKYRQAYLNVKYLSITIDPETQEEIRVENPDYKTRAEREAIEETAKATVSASQRQNLNYSAVKKVQINKLLSQGKVSEAIKLKGGL